MTDCSCTAAALCLACVAQRVAGERAAQGLPDRVLDPAALARVASLVDLPLPVELEVAS